MKQKNQSNPQRITPTCGATTTLRELIDPPQSASDTSAFLLRRELAERLQVSLRTIDRWLRLGLIPRYKVGNSTRFLWTDVCESLRRNFRLTPGGRHE